MRNWNLVKKNGEWRSEKGGRAVPGTKASTKKAALSKTTAKARSAGTASDPISLKVRGEDGKIQQERTYPRSADPRRSKG